MTSITIDLERAAIPEPRKALQEIVQEHGNVKKTENGFFVWIPLEDGGAWIVHLEGNRKIFEEMIQFCKERFPYIRGSGYRKGTGRLWRKYEPDVRVIGHVFELRF